MSQYIRHPVKVVSITASPAQHCPILHAQDGGIRHKQQVTIAVMVRRSLNTTPEEKAKQFRSPVRVATWVNGNESGQLVETAGLLDGVNQSITSQEAVKRRAMIGRNPQII